MDITRIVIWIILSVLSCGAGHAKGLLRENYWSEMVEDTTIAPAARLVYFDSLLNNSGADKVAMLHQKAELLEKMLRHSEVADVYAEILDSDELTLRERCETMLLRCRKLIVDGRLAEGTQGAIEFLKLPKPDSLAIFDVDAYVILAAAKIDLGIVDRATPELNEAERVLERYRKVSDRDDLNEMSLALKRIKATYFTEIGQYEKALVEIKGILSSESDALTRYNLYGYIADIYLMAGESAIAEKYYRRILDSNLVYFNRAVAVCNYMHLLIKERRYGDALNVYNNNSDKIDITARTVVQTNINANLAEALAGLGRYDEAYRLMFDAKVVRDSLNATYTSGDRLARYELEMATVAKDKAMDNSEVMRKRMMVAILFLAAGCLLCVILLIRLRREQRRSHIASRRLSQAESEHRRDVAVKNERIDSQNRELTACTLQLAQVQELLSELTSITENQHTPASQRLREVQTRIKQLEMQGNMWDIFKTYFEQTHPDFFKCLYEHHPDLSAGEIRMCAYMMLNLTGKEIATLTNRSYRTVETIKYRLHKKLGLADEPTVSYLHRIMQ